uniref:Uncharacterized protein n=1 Tax=Parascaris univalens TaxID=6257 RepID=A0A915ANP1_PARUN
MNNFMNTANGWRLPPFHSLTGDNGGNSRRGDGFNNFFSNNNNTSFAGTNNRNCINGSNVGNVFNRSYHRNIGRNFDTFGDQNARMNAPCYGNIGHENMMNNGFNGRNNFCSMGGSFNSNGNFPSPFVNSKVDQRPSLTGVHTNLSDAGIPDGYQRVQCTQPAMVVHCCPGGTCILIGNGIAGNIWEHVTWPQDYECNLIPYPVQPNC